MPTREQVQELVRHGVDYATIGSRLGIAPGLAYLIATGLPADGSDVPEVAPRAGALPSSQQLTGAGGVENPTSRESVRAWIRARVDADAQMRAAGGDG